MQLRWYDVAIPILSVALVFELACGDDDGASSPRDAGSTQRDATTAPADAAPADAAPADATPGDASETPICTVPVGHVSTDGELKIFTVDVKLAGAPGTCVVHTGKQFTYAEDVQMQIGFRSGSPGYSANPRFDYQIKSASPGEVVQGGEAANLLEGNLVTLAVARREGADAGPPGPYRLRFRMNADPDPAKWTLSLFTFGPQ